MSMLKNKVRILALILCAVLVLGIAGCGRSEPSPTATVPESKAPATQAPQSQTPTNTVTPPSQTPTNTVKPPSGDPIIIGLIGSLTGQWEIYGHIAKNTAEIAVENINAAGGILGRPVILKIYDNQSEPVETTNVARKAILEDKVCAFVGPDSGAALLTMYPVCEEYGVPSMAYASSSMTVTQNKDGSPRPWRFRVNLAAHQATSVMAKYASTKMGYKRIGALYDVAMASGVDGITYFEAALKETGGTLVFKEGYKTGDIDFRAQLSSIKSRLSEIDALYIPAQYTELGLIANQIKELGIEIPLIGDRGWMMYDTFKVAGDNLNGAHFNADMYPKDERYKDFIAQYDGRHGKNAVASTGSDAFFCYDAFLVLFNAIEKAGTNDPAKIRDSIEKNTKDLKVLSGIITIDPVTHNCHRPVCILTIENQDFKKAADFIVDFG